MEWAVFRAVYRKVVGSVPGEGFFPSGDSPGEKESQESAGEGTVPIAAVE